MQLGNGWEFVVLTLACLRAGIVPVMALPAHRRTELAYLARHAEATAIAVPDRLRDFDHQQLAHDLADEVRAGTDQPWHVLVAGAEIAPGSVDLRALCAPSDQPSDDRERLDALPISSRDVAVFLLSGGTTGLPKLIARTHDDYAYNARASRRGRRGRRGHRLPGGPASRAQLPAGLPGHPRHAAGRRAGGHAALRRSRAAPSRRSPPKASRTPRSCPPWPRAGSTTPPSTAPTSSPPCACCRSAAPGSPTSWPAGSRPVLGATLQQVFGMAEGLLNYTRLDDPEEIICTTQGRPMCPDDEVRLVDELDHDVPDGEPGSLLTRGPYTPRGYYKAAEQNARAFTPDGWYRSGDICRRTAGGNLIVEGRDKDMINRGGEKISAEEVENLVYQLPDVKQVAAVAMPDPLLGERVCLYVVARPGTQLTLEEIRESMERAGVARFKLPEHLVFVDELPATKVGKIDKKALRDDIARRLAQ